MKQEPPAVFLDNLDRDLIALTQKGLPLVSRPYHYLAEKLGLSGEQVMLRIKALQGKGVIRRIGLIPNHYRLGYCANGMTVWDVPDEQTSLLGPRIGALSFVSHCYRRPRYLPEWPYNLFAMVHARSRAEVEELAQEISDILGEHNRGHKILYSTRILKKTGLRLAGDLSKPDEGKRENKDA
ncbi:AsnC family transcriptional regulator [Kiloniella laminariae]|uniref:siroheme decarboxylase n=1 Tax=Kiloniella laminariae TaxID=454162 RepID=A0ABT4LGS9_9PROT|nr:AsnC family transcriptional regulator [Kiloniella laminariae]MCZ4280310.1 AsnC family transcriptional regulator [Kiloniella laminariae]